MKIAIKRRSGISSGKSASGPRKRGAITVEYVLTVFVVFLFLFFPLINLGTICVRAFFLWFACNQAVMAGCKAKTLASDITIGGTTYRCAYTLANQRANQIRATFSGIDWTSSVTNPRIEIMRTPMPNSPPPVTYYPPFVCTGPGVAVPGQAPDIDKYIVTLRITINGRVFPLIPMTLGNLSIPGLTTPFDMTVRSEAAFENPPGINL